MIVVGISGMFHDSAAAVVRDGVIVAAAQEERFTRRKHEARLPISALGFCLDAAEVGPGEIDRVVYYEKPISAFARSMSSLTHVAPRGFGQFRRAVPAGLGSKLWVEGAVDRMLRRLGHRPPGRLLFTEHHEAHAASAFYPSPFPSAAVLTLDGVGEWATVTVGRGSADGVVALRQIRYPHSIGLLYSAFTSYCGFRVNGGEAKLMGLAPYGRPEYRDLILSELVDLRSDGSFHLRLDAFGFLSGSEMTTRTFDRLFGGPPRRPSEPLTQRHADLARSAQDVVEEMILRISGTAREITGERRLCLAGGVALNAVANGRLLRSGIFDDVWVQPCSGDGGGALGAALEGWHRAASPEERSREQRSGDAGRDGMTGCRLGPAFDDDAVVAELLRRRIDSELLGEDEWADRVADLLADGRVVGWFDGPMEFGPRALGGRSILADPRSTTVVERINSVTKRREGFRPFAPIVLEERASDWFELDRPAPYMTFVVQVASRRRRPEEPGDEWPPDRRLRRVRSEIGAVTHVDGSARVQTVSRAGSPRLHALLSAFDRATGCPVLLNTSLNVRGEPIVCTPADAIAMFLATDLDHLMFGRRLVSRTEAAPTG